MKSSFRTQVKSTRIPTTHPLLYVKPSDADLLSWSNRDVATFVVWELYHHTHGGSAMHWFESNWMFEVPLVTASLKWWDAPPRTVHAVVQMAKAFTKTGYRKQEPYVTACQNATDVLVAELPVVLDKIEAHFTLRAAAFEKEHTVASHSHGQGKL